jgi:nucleoside 2-deoxyribosyltransferase
MAFAVRRMTARLEPVLITSDVLRSLRDTAALPAPESLLDEAVLWFGQQSNEAGHLFQVTYRKCKAALGLVTPQAFEFLADWMLRSDLFEGLRPAAINTGREPIPIHNCRLNPEGWRRYGELSRSHAASRYGFMAMMYGDQELDAVVANHFVPEVRKTGFDLRRLDQGQPAGLIDDQLRVMIRASRFLICDLTHGNRGAYWESGFAEGLGKPVIYTCRSEVFRDRQHEHHPHFDTNHMVTVIWDPADLATAARRLKDTIRATLPSEANLQD